jgi:LAO/AO transport system kinase
MLAEKGRNQSVLSALRISELEKKPDLWAREVMEGNLLAASRLMRYLDDRSPGAVPVMKILFQHTGKAHIVGLTGAPGSGKSTLVDQLVAVARKKQLTVGVVAVDPSSPFTEGAILGDRIRMKRHSTDPGVFIRSVATRGQMGGLSSSTNDIVDVMDAMGKDLIVIETVGVGQDELDIVRLAHTSIVVQVPGMGDDVQAIKAGILEIGDIFVVNKADREGVDRTVKDLEVMLHFKKRTPDSFVPPVLKTQADVGQGVEELVDQIERHKGYLRRNCWQDVEKKRLHFRFQEMLKEALLKQITNKLESSRVGQGLLEKLYDKALDPYTAVQEIMESLFFC